MYQKNINDIIKILTILLYMYIFYYNIIFSTSTIIIIEVLLEKPLTQWSIYLLSKLHNSCVFEIYNL